MSEIGFSDRTLSQPSVVGMAKQSKFELPDRTIAQSSVDGKAKERVLNNQPLSELTSHHFDMGIEMDCEDEGVNDGYSGVATGTDEERVFKKSLFKLSTKEKNAVAAKAAGYLSRKKFVVNKPVADDSPDSRATGSGCPVQWVPPELEEIDGMLKPVEQKLPQVHDTSYEEAKKVPSRFQGWSEEDLLDYLMECDD